MQTLTADAPIFMDDCRKPAYHIPLKTAQLGFMRDCIHTYVHTYTYITTETRPGLKTRK